MLLSGRRMPLSAPVPPMPLLGTGRRSSDACGPRWWRPTASGLAVRAQTMGRREGLRSAARSLRKGPAIPPSAQVASCPRPSRYRPSAGQRLRWPGDLPSSRSATPNRGTVLARTMACSSPGCPHQHHPPQGWACAEPPTQVTGATSSPTRDPRDRNHRPRERRTPDHLTVPG